MKKLERVLKRRFKFVVGTMVLVFIASAFSIVYISNKTWPTFMNYAKVNATHIITEIITQSVQEKIPIALSEKELFTTEKDSNGLITMIDYNPVTINQLLVIVNKSVQQSLRALELGDIDTLTSTGIVLDEDVIQKIKDGLVTKIPIGTISNNILLSNLGPNIPVKVHFIGNVVSNISSKISTYGINNVLLEAFIKISINVQIALPLYLEEVNIGAEIPLALKVIQGKVPNYYQQGYNSNSNLLSIPFIENNENK